LWPENKDKNMNRRIKKEWIKCGLKGLTKAPMKDCSNKLLYLLFRRNDRVAKREKR
jgi:hypothetical protein